MAPAAICSRKRVGRRGVALSEEAQVDRELLGGLEHAVDVPLPGRARRRRSARRRAGATAHQRGEPGADRLGDDLWTDEVDVAVQPARGDDFPFTSNHFGRGAYDHARGHSGHEVGVAGLTDGDDAAVANADVGLHDAPVIDDHGVGDDRVERGIGSSGPCRLAHAVADHLAAAELRFLAGQP